MAAGACWSSWWEAWPFPLGVPAPAEESSWFRVRMARSTPLIPAAAEKSWHQGDHHRGAAPANGGKLGQCVGFPTGIIFTDRQIEARMLTTLLLVSWLVCGSDTCLRGTSLSTPGLSCRQPRTSEHSAKAEALTANLVSINHY